MENKEKLEEAVAKMNPAFEKTTENFKNNLLMNTLPTLLSAKSIKVYDKLKDKEFADADNSNIVGRLFRVAERAGQVSNVTSIAHILDRNKLFVLEDMLDNNNGRMFCFEYEDEQYLIRRERSFVSIDVKSVFSSVADLGPIANILEAYKQESGNIYYIVKDNSNGDGIEISFITPNLYNPNAYLNIGIITMPVANAKCLEGMELYGNELLKEGIDNLGVAKSNIKSSVSHLFQKTNSLIDSFQLNHNANYDAFNVFEYSKDLIRKFLEVAQHSLAYGIELDLIDVLDSTLINEIKEENIPGILGTKLIIPTPHNVYAFSLYLLILNSTIIETIGTGEYIKKMAETSMIPGDDINFLFQNETEKIANKSLLKTKDLLSVIIAGSKNAGGLDMSASDAKTMLKLFNNIKFLSGSFVFIDIDIPYCTLYSMLIGLSNKLDIFNVNIKDALKDAVERYMEASKIEVGTGDDTENIQPEPLTETKEISEAFVTTGEQKMIAVDNEINGLPADNINTTENKFDDEILEADDSETLKVASAAALGHTANATEEHF